LLSAGCAVAAAAALTRSRPGQKSSSAVICCAGYNASNEIGASDPLLFWDPIGFCEGGTKEEFDRRRAVEIKHGRLCMLAAIGMLWPDLFGRFNGYLSPSQNLKFADIPGGLGALSKIPVEGYLQILVLGGLIETQLLKDQSYGGFGYAKYGAEPGNFGTGYWGRKIKDPAERRQKLTAELNNGRLAMIAVTGMLIQNGLTGQSPIDQLASGHISPFNDGQGLFAFDASKELGAAAPLGYWDPFGFMAFGDKAKFQQYREAELKHGRVAMIATIGIVVPDTFGRLGGYLSPSAGLKFTDIPSSIEAIGKVPTLGWLQIFALAGALEEKAKAFPQSYGYPAFIQGPPLKEPERSKKLLAELNNGRLAMIAFAAIVAQNGITGQSLVEQFSSGNLNPWVGGYAVSLSKSLPWAPVPEGLSNDPLDKEYIGDFGFDPLGLAKNSRLLPWYREAELAHGRVTMLAVLGLTVQVAGLKIEPFITKYVTDSNDPLKAATQVPIVGWLQILAVIMLSELWRYQNVISQYSNGVKPGDLGWNPKAPQGSVRPKWFGPTFEAPYSNEEWSLMKLREIKHCRLAMIGFAYLIIESAAAGRGYTLVISFATPEFAGTVGDFVPKGL